MKRDLILNGVLLQLCAVYQKDLVKKNVDLLLIGEGDKKTMFLAMISVDLHMIIHYIVEENMFVVVVFMLSL